MTADFSKVGVRVGLRYLGARGSSVRSRPMNPRIRPTGLVTGKISRSRRVSTRLPESGDAGEVHRDELLVAHSVTSQLLGQSGPAVARVAGDGDVGVFESKGVEVDAAVVEQVAVGERGRDGR